MQTDLIAVFENIVYQEHDTANGFISIVELVHEYTIRFAFAVAERTFQFVSHFFYLSPYQALRANNHRLRPTPAPAALPAVAAVAAVAAG